MHILVVEDEKVTATVVRVLLEDELEAAVDTALDCASARELLSSNSYDLITMDYQLPDGDGLSLLEEILKMDGAPPVIMVTGHGDEQTAVSAFKLGASGYVVKDARMSTLLIEEARSALARAGLEFERRQLLSIFDSIDEIVYVSDPETYEVLYANMAIRKVFGDIVGRKCYEALQGFSEPCQFCTNDRIFGEHDGEAYVWEFKNTLDGRWYRCIDRAIRWPNGKAVRYEMAIDITERKAAEEALQRSEAEYRAVVEDQTELIVRFEQGGILTFLNDAICSFTGLPREELLGMSFMTFIPEGEQMYMQEQLASLNEENQVAMVEHRVVLPSGEVRYMQWVNRALFDEQGNIIEFQGVGRDITERKQAEEALREERTFIQDALGAIPDAFIVYDLEAKPLRWNRAFDELTGYSDDEIPSMAASDFHPEEDIQFVAEAFGKVVQTGNPMYIETRILNKNGRAIRCSLSGSLLRNTDGEPIALCGVGRDITKRIEAEAEARLYRDHLEELVGERTVELERANAELEGYAHTVSHDLTGPLSAVALAAEMLSGILEGDGGAGPGCEVEAELRVIGDGTWSAMKLTGDLLALAEAGQTPAKREPVDISGVLRSILQEKEALLEERGVRVSVDDDLGVAAMDPTHAYQLFANLIGNAIKHNDSENPEIHVSRQGEAEPGMLRYLVRDNGPGIPDGEMEDIFLPFHRGPDSTDTGIGLSIVDKVVKLYGGQIRAYNDGGACFEFTLPIYSS